jgi:hypothetical protein
LIYVQRQLLISKKYDAVYLPNGWGIPCGNIAAAATLS